MPNNDLCVHRWLIDPANGPYAGGVCRNCGEERSFRTSLDATDYNQKTITPEMTRAIRRGHQELSAYEFEAGKLVFSGHEHTNVIGVPSL